MIKRKIFLFIICLQAFFCFSQKGKYTGMNVNAFPSRYNADIYFLKRKQSAYGQSFSIGAGQYGERISDNKTKDLFGRKYKSSELGVNYYKTNNLGVQGKYSYSYQFGLNKNINLDLGFCGLIGIYQQKSEFDAFLFDENNKYGLLVVKEKYIRFNIAVGFELEMLWKLSKKWQIVTGLKLPFYVINNNQFGLSKAFDPPLIGMEPIINAGVRYQLHK